MLETDIRTPALVLHMEAFERNLVKMKAICDSVGIAMRPHYKSAKCTAIALREIAAGAKGMCCAKVSEARDLVECGIEDVLIANQIPCTEKLAEAAALARCCRLTVCVDSAENIDALERAAALFGAAIYCLVEYDLGMDRCGVTEPEAFLALVRRIEAEPHLHFEGIQAYAGHLAHCEDGAKRRAETEKVELKLKALKAYIEKNGFYVKEVSGISTGTIELRPKDTVYTEMQCGSFIYMDAAYKKVGAGFEHALFVLASVMDGYPTHTTLDAGIKAVSTDQRPPFFYEYPDLPIDFSEEHCTIPTRECGRADKLHMVPSHCCTTVNLYDWMYLVRDGRVVDKIPVTGRGKSV